jgi:hypothetical protein
MPRALRILGLGCLVCLSAFRLAAAPSLGRISGLVLDPSGTPQLGATVVISPEKLADTASTKLLTNDSGRFSINNLVPGTYSIKVTLAGFMPAMQQHVRVDDTHITLLEIVLGSLFSSFEKLRRQPTQSGSPDDWTWVLRSSPDTRSVLQWQEGTTVSLSSHQLGEPAPQQDPDRGRVEFLSGGDHPGSFANAPGAPATAFAYDVGLTPNSQFLVAGKVSLNYGSVEPTGALAAEWLPSGKPGVGPVTTIVIRENSLGPNTPVFRGMRLSHDSQLALGDRVSLRYGGDYIFAGLAGTTSSLRPRAQVAVQLAETWQISAAMAALPWENNASQPGALSSSLNSLDEFPTLMVRAGHIVLENDLHEELALDHRLTNSSSIGAAFFHDGSSHTAVIGRGSASTPDFLQPYSSQTFAYDGGATSSDGVRVVYRQRLGDYVGASVVYAYAGALAPAYSSSTAHLREELTTENRHSVATRISTSLPATGTKLTVSYKWLDGPTVSQQDSFGQAAYDVDPYLSFELRQPLPKAFPGHMEIDAAAGNLLAQGYVPIATNHGDLVLVPAYRYFSGGFSVQF